MADAPQGNWLTDLMSNPLFVAGLGMLGSSQPPGPAFLQSMQGASGLQQAQQQMALQRQQIAASQQQVQSGQQEQQLRGLALQQAQNRMNFDPSQYLLANEQQAGGAGWQRPQGAIGNVDMTGLLGSAYKAGMGPEDAQMAAGIMDPMTQIRMKLMSQPALAVAPGGSLVSPGMAQLQQMSGQQQPMGGGGGGAGGTASQPGALFTNNNPPPDSPLAQINMLTKTRDQYQPGTPQYNMYDSAINKVTGSWEQGNPNDVDSVAASIASGKMAPLTGNAMRSPISQRVMARVTEMNPQYNSHDWAMNDKAYEDFATGQQGNQVRSLNVAVNHLNALGGLAAALQNGNVQKLNEVRNAYKTQTGQDAPTNFETAKTVVGDEVVKAVIGSGGAQSDRDQAQKVIDAANSPAQLLGAINTYKTLLGGQLNGLSKQYQASTGRNDFAERLLNPNTVKATVKGNPVQEGGYSLDDINAELQRRK